ncbi:MAG: hypothetical protein ACR2FV_13835 [Ornithinimicrobium sp.]|jgi:N-acetylglucosamine-6-phosphate deacetylase|uniref:hypothetical protein n=1 Tax=Ornithinimicrobium sp. TaxID=1977084 RepID=UPI003D9B8824
MHGAASTPSAAIGLERVGGLSPGRQADLVLLGADHLPVGVMAGGSWVAKP